MKYSPYWSGLDAYHTYANRPRLDQENEQLVVLRVAIHLYIMWYRQAKREKMVSPSLYCLKKADNMRRIGLHFYHEIVFCNRLIDQGCKRHIAYTFRKSLFGFPRAFWKVEYAGDKE